MQRSKKYIYQESIINMLKFKIEKMQELNPNVPRSKTHSRIKP